MLEGKHMRTMNRSFIIAAAIFACALAVRVLFLLLLGSEQRIYDSTYDQYIYIDIARNLIQGRGLSTTLAIFAAIPGQPTSIQPPLYPLILAGMFSIFGENYLAVRLLQAVVSAGICLCVYLIGKKTVGEGMGRLAGVIAIFYPPLVMYTRPLMTETFYTFFFCLLVLLLVQFATRAFRIMDYIRFGILLSLTFMLRPEIFLFGLLVAVFAAGWTLTQQRVRFYSVIIGITLATCAFFLTTLPWALRNQQVHGQLIWSANKRTILWEENWLRYTRATVPDWQPGRGLPGCTNELVCSIPHFDQLSELQRDQYLTNIAQDFIFSHPMVYARYGISRLLISYPFLPREELRPPIGYKGVRYKSDDGFDYTSLDDQPTYTRGPEKARVWAFRLIFALAVLGSIIAVKKRAWLVLLPLLPVLFNVLSAFLLGGKERFRIPIDPYLVIVAAYGIMWVALSIQITLRLRGNRLADIKVLEVTHRMQDR
jgi:4-amino-4-deoxy-L-arabinose transferase-like glycosyltransferase